MAPIQDDIERVRNAIGKALFYANIRVGVEAGHGREPRQDDLDDQLLYNDALAALDRLVAERDRLIRYAEEETT